MKYQLIYRMGHAHRVETYFGAIVNLETREVVFSTTAMSESGVVQILDNELRRLVRDDAKSEKIEFVSGNT